VSGVALVLVLAGAGCEEGGQAGARKAVQAHLRTLPDSARYRLADVHCTRGGRYVYFGSVRTTRYFCTARVAAGGDCDLFQADALGGGRARITLVRRSAGCVLPAG
jgi:hypothetical protein